MKTLSRLVIVASLLVGGLAQAKAPKLVVLVAVDQMRADYFDWYGAHWKGGLKRIFDKGANFKNARYPYLNTVTCPGHATLGTGAYPHTHGMILNTWYDRERQKVIECTDDQSAPLVAIGNAKTMGGDSSKNLMVPTLGDEMQAQLSPKSRVVSFSLKARSATNMAGHKPDLTMWFEASTWVTSSAFTTTIPHWVQKLVETRPMSASIGAPWDKILPAAAYKFADDAVGEKAGGGWSNSFPHPLKAGPGLGRWGSSPLPDEYLGQLARTAIGEMKLGQGASTDLLAVGFSMTDLVGHSFGPRSHEVQDTLARLDGVLGTLLQVLDAQVKDGYVIALSADHGVAMIPEQLQAEGKDAGRINAGELRKRTNEAITVELGAGDHVAQLQSNDIYLQPGVHDKLAAKEGAIGRVLAAVKKTAGVAEALDSSEIADPSKAKDPLRKAAALSYFPGRSGDIQVSPKPNWIQGALGTNHGSTNDYDQRVPLVFYGAGIKPGTYDQAASPADMAPTMAALIGVKMPKAEGTARTEAFAK